MTAQVKWTWFERQFRFDYPPEKMPDVIERLRGTPLRAAALVDHVPAATLTQRLEDSWSIQENVAHLSDLEPLWHGRVEDILAGHEIMREADLTNSTTASAGHNRRDIGDVLDEVRQVRMRFVDLVEQLSADQWSATSLHPRLKTPMRIVDLCTFVAEHDDYHLSRVTWLKNRFRDSGPA